MNITVAIAIIIFLSVLVQAVSGSGLGLVGMPLLVSVISPVEASALMALIAICTQAVIMLRYRSAIAFDGLWRPVAGALIGIPIGIVTLSHLDQHIILTLLGVILVVYTLYSLIAPQIPRLVNGNWGYVFGLASGLLHGAYNTGGPPYVIYGVSQRWSPPQFKCNLQVLLMVNGVSVLIAHFTAGHYTAAVWQDFLIALPMVGLGALAGFFLDRYINEVAFNKIVLVLLLIIGIKMLIP